jgi:hypothetical protein
MIMRKKRLYKRRKENKRILNERMRGNSDPQQAAELLKKEQQ